MNFGVGNHLEGRGSGVPCHGWCAIRMGNDTAAVEAIVLFNDRVRRVCDLMAPRRNRTDERVEHVLETLRCEGPVVRGAHRHVPRKIAR